MIRTKGIKEVVANFSALPTDVGLGMREALNQSVLMIQADARRAIEKISGGKVYVRKRGKRRTGVHIASKAGDAPNKDTGNLIRNIRVSKVKGNARRGYSATVKATTPYASSLEYGTRRMKARPFMAPALAKNKPKIEKLIRDAVRSAL